MLGSQPCLIINTDDMMLVGFGFNDVVSQKQRSPTEEDEHDGGGKEVA